MAKTTTAGGAGNAVAEFFRQTFRRHSGAEYSELITRGLRSKRGVNKRYPWAYIRLFTLLFVLFAVFVLIVRFTSNQLFLPTITVLASLCVNLPFLLLIYELYPQKDVSFIGVCLALLIGGAGANVFSQILFSIFPPANDWLSAVLTGFFEELPKAVATIASIIIGRKNSPLAGFLFGAAVGCGFSISEDMGYIFVQANEVSPMNLATVVEISLARGLTAVCTHTLWTGAVGWAYCHFTRHFANVMFYVVLLFSCGLHIAWDLPLGVVALALVNVGCGIAACVECILIMHFERKKVYANNTLRPDDLYKNEETVKQVWDQAEQQVQAQEALNKHSYLFWRHWKQVTFVLAAFLMAVAAVIYSTVPFQETYGTQEFSSSEAFVLYMQDGRVFNCLDVRAYNKYDTADDIELRENGVLVRVTQRVKDKTDDTVIYNYVYAVSHDDTPGYERDHYFLNSVYVSLQTDLGENVIYREDVYNNGVLYASFFRVRSDVTGFMFDSSGDVTVITYNPAFVMDLSDWKYLSLFIMFATTIGAALVTGTALQIKGWRVKKQCSTKDVSSAE